jgi:O-antigen ligase
MSCVLLTQSRGGIASFLIGLVVLIVCLWRTSARTPTGAARWLSPASLVLVVGVAIWIAAAPIIERAQNQGVEDASRIAIAQASLKAIAAAPLVGNGFGAFERYYPFYADGSVPGDVDAAHDDYLETLADLGLLAGLAFIAAPALLVFLCVSGSLTRRRDRIFPAVGAATSALVAAHALIDFSLQIPAVALLFTMSLGLGTAQAWSTAQRPE